MSHFQQFKQGPIYMPPVFLRQLQYETDTWKRLLEFMIGENISLRNRLSEIIKEKTDHATLEALEDFQRNFIKVDELMGLLRNEVVELEKLFRKESFDGGKITIEQKMEQLRNDIMIAERQFRKLNLEFNNYLSLNI